MLEIYCRKLDAVHLHIPKCFLYLIVYPFPDKYSMLFVYSDGSTSTFMAVHKKKQFPKYWSESKNSVSKQV